MRGWVVWAAFLAAGCTTHTSEQPTVPPPPVVPFQAGIELSSSEALLQNSVTSTRFNFLQLRDLWVRVKLPPIAQLSTLYLGLTEPNGSVAYQTTLQISPDPSMQTMTMPGAMHPVTVLHAKPIPGGVAFDRSIPIAGTVITRNYLNAGTWIITARSGGQQLSAELDVSVTP
jgi:hypothetical protein